MLTVKNYNIICHKCKKEIEKNNTIDERKEYCEVMGKEEIFTIHTCKYCYIQELTERIKELEKIKDELYNSL